MDKDLMNLLRPIFAVRPGIGKTLARALFDLIPPDSAALLKLAHRYIDRHNGDNNSDPATNGEELLLRLVMPAIKTGVIFDVGANIGDWSQYVLPLAPDARVHMFEPSLPTFAECNSRTWPPGVVLNAIGLGERNEILDLNIVSQGSGMNSLYRRRGVQCAEPSGTERVQIVTLDEYCENNGIDRIDYMKVDVEGHELAVFCGATRMLTEGRIDMIQFEYGGSNLDARVYLRDIWDLLSQTGFLMAKIFPQGPRPIGGYEQSLESFKYANFLACRDDAVVMGRLRCL